MVKGLIGIMEDSADIMMVKGSFTPLLGKGSLFFYIIVYNEYRIQQI